MSERKMTFEQEFIAVLEKHGVAVGYPLVQTGDIVDKADRGDG